MCNLFTASSLLIKGISKGETRIYFTSLLSSWLASTFRILDRLGVDRLVRGTVSALEIQLEM